MAEPLDLTPGRDQPSEGWEGRRDVLVATVEKYLPEFVQAVREFREGKVHIIMLHQDAFAGGYHTDEYTLLGLALKYAGLHGAPVNFCGTNGETFGQGPARPPSPRPPGMPLLPRPASPKERALRRRRGRRC
jgi:hypothetical protein